MYALYDFHPGDRDEIALRAGDRIELIQKDDTRGDWFEGKNANGRIGLFPKNYVTPTRLTPEYVYATNDFNPQNEDEISLHAGDLIEVVAHKHDDWLWGKKLDGTLGLFPQNHIVSVPQSPEYVYVAYDFDPQEEDEIRLHFGERIEVIQKHDHWWRGRKLDGTLGLFPPSYTVPVPQNPEYVYAIYDFNPQDEDEIRLHAGDPVEVIQKSDNWWRGKNIDGEFGLFPRNYTSHNLVDSSAIHVQPILGKFISKL